MSREPESPRSLSLVVPVYDSPDLAVRLASRLAPLERAAAECGFKLIEAIFVDDGSASPLALPSAPPVRVIRHSPNRGKGFAVREGALAAKGDWVLMSDVDESAPLAEFAKLAPSAAAWMVCGSRYAGRRAGVPPHRRLLSWLFRLCVRCAGVRGVRDTQCGFKLFRMDAMRPIFESLATEGFAFDVELLLRVVRAGGEVVEVPVEWRGGARSSLRVWRDAPKMLAEVFRIRKLLRGK